jgi:hypothetical protein
MSICTGPPGGAGAAGFADELERVSVADESVDCEVLIVAQATADNLFLGYSLMNDVVNDVVPT